MSIQAKLDLIVSRSARLEERVASFRASRIPKSVPADGRQLVAGWRKWVSFGDHAVFRRRLAMMGIDEAQAAYLCGNDYIPLSKPLPEWAEVLLSILSRQTAKKRNGILDVWALFHECPFTWPLLPFVDWAIETLGTSAGSALEALHEEAQIGLGQTLLDHLIWLSQRVFVLEMNDLRAAGHLYGDTPRERFADYQTRFLRNQEYFEDVLIKYPVLARLLTTATMDWVACQLAFLRRFQEDEEQLFAMFGGKCAQGKMTSIEGNLSDRHYQGRTTLRITFESGLQILYKPKSLMADASFQALLAWINQKGDLLDLRGAKLLPRQCYGWSEWISHVPCTKEAEVRAFYQRQGMYLALFHVLGGTDLHCGNIIACGEYPILIDLETLLPQQLLCHSGSSLIDNRYSAFLAASVLHTGMLPTYAFGQSGRPGVDLSGLGAYSGQKLPRQQYVWKDAGSDTMRLEPEMSTLEVSSDHLPFLDGGHAHPADYVDDVVAGFGSLYDFCCQQRAEFVAEDGPLHHLARSTYRYVPRPTQVYYDILDRSIDPSLLRSGAARDAFLEVLWYGRVDEPILARLASSEQTDLWHGNIPHFTFSALGTDLISSHGAAIPDVFTTPSIQMAIARVSHASQTDQRSQERTICTAFAAVHAERQHKKDGGHVPPCHKGTSADTLIFEAIRIGDELYELASVVDGQAMWLGLEYDGASQHYQLRPIGRDLYNGTAGVALFAANLFSITHEERFRDLALQSSAEICHLIDHRSHCRAMMQDGALSLGGFTGIGAYVYLLSRLAALLEEKRLLNVAYRYSTLLEPTIIARDTRFDIISGAAGCILSLLRLYKATGKLTVLARAEALGRHLLDHQLAGLNPHAWLTTEAKIPLTGMAHGAAGISYALLALDHVTKTHQFRGAALEALAYERTLFSPSQRNWPDLRVRTHRRGLAYMVAWCHGATGIGLARLGCLDAIAPGDLSYDAMKDEIEHALTTTEAALATGKDHLCCGLFGKLDLLVEASLRLDRPHLLQHARDIASSLVERRALRGHWALGPQPRAPLLLPGLMQGIAGIGFELLRLAAPDQVKSVLLLA